MANPYTDIYKRVRQVVEGVPGIRPGNKIGASNRPDKGDPASFINAELRVRPAPGGSANPWATSSRGVFVQHFDVQMATDQQEPDRLFEVKWLVMNAFYDAGPDLGMPELVSRVNFPDVSEAHDNADLNKGIPYAWSGVVTVSVEFRPKRDQMHTV